MFVYALIAVVALLTIRYGPYAAWWIVGQYRIRRARPRRVRASRHLIWLDPADGRDPADGPGGAESAPQPPFSFIEEHLTGTQPCVSVRDARRRVWRVKWGEEVRSETFAARFAWACGYFAQPTHFVRCGTIAGSGPDLKRAGQCISADTGQFRDARFQLDEPEVRKFFDEYSWSWDDNPFVGTPQLSGLKIVVMLLSNWDTKDRRDVARGSNTAIFEYGRGYRKREARYVLSDWGGSMGRWGETIVTRGRWDADAFVEQTSQFVTGVADGVVTFGYAGQRTADVARGIPVAHVRWFLPLVHAITNESLTRALAESGATDVEASRFSGALLERIVRLREAARDR
jgi:hypothetical protein